ncbi:hypothetical protein D3C80_1864680 [compost metagenome]
MQLPDGEPKLFQFLAVNNDGRKGFIAGKSADFDTPRFGRFRNDTFQIDIQQTVRQIGRFYLDMLSQLEFALEITFRNALI